MPGGLAFDSTQSYVAFATVKFVGYSLSTAYYDSRHRDTRVNPFLFGLARTLLGMLLGAVAGLAGLIEFELALFTFMVGLIPFRIFEWYLTLKLFYGKSENFKEAWATDIALGVAVSFILDIPAMFGFLMTGGLWIC